MIIDKYSTHRAVFDVVKTHLIQDANNKIAPKIIASFMDYQDCYVFMNGIVVGLDLPFNECSNFDVVTSKEKGVSYKIASRNIYIGRKAGE